MKLTVIRVLCMALVASLLVATPVLAYSYYSSITVTEDGTSSYPMLAANASMDVDYMASKGYMSSSGLDTRVTTGDVAVPHMLAGDRLLFCYPVDKNSGNTFKFSTGNEALDSFYVIVGYNGSITIPDDPSIELGDNFIVEQKGWVDTTAGSNKNLVNKADAFRVYVNAAGEITAVVAPGASEVTVTATGINSGVHIVKVTADGIDLKIYVDGTEKDSATLTGGVPPNANPWTIMQNNVMPYMEYMKIQLG